MNDYNDDKTRAHLALTKGAKVEHYIIENKIGAGGMGEVYLADDTKLNRRVALKFMPAHLASNEELRLRFTREAQAAAKLEHPNIVTIFEVGEFDKRPFFAMQYISGKTIHHYCHNEKLSVDKIINLMIQAAEGLSKAHRNGIIHRDIKSVNILVNDDFRVKILDFGLASVQGDENITKAGSTMGTFAYMSPEQAGGKELDHRSDIFSLGVVMYELLCGVSPFKDANEAAVLNNILNKKPDELSKYNKEIPFALEEVVRKSLEKNKEDRYQTAEELKSALKNIESELNSKNCETDQKPTIAVLPFANMSTDPENEFFADGLTEELLNVLAKIPELKVTGRTSSFAFKGKNEDLRSIGSKLGVETILEGSVRKAGNRVRITSQLVKTSDGFHLWSETYDRVIEDIFAVQDEIAESVAKELHITLLGKSKEKHTNNMGSYELVLKGQQARHQWSKESIEEAIGLFKKAIELDSKNAKAWVGLANCYTMQAGYGYGDEGNIYLKGKECAEKAYGLDPNLPEASAALSLIHGAFLFNYEKSLALLRKAFELAPNNSQIIGSYALVTALFIEIDKAIPLAKLALELDPLNSENHMLLGKMYYWNNQFEQSRKHFAESLKITPSISSVYLNLSWIKMAEGDYNEALRLAKKEKSDGYRLTGEAMAYFAMGDDKKGQDALDELSDKSYAGHWSFQVANVYAVIKDYDNAFKWLDYSLETHDAGVPLSRVHPLLKPISNDPRWKEYLIKAGFTKEFSF